MRSREACFPHGRDALIFGIKQITHILLWLNPGLVRRRKSRVVRSLPVRLFFGFRNTSVGQPVNETSIDRKGVSGYFQGVKGYSCIWGNGGDQAIPNDHVRSFLDLSGRLNYTGIGKYNRAGYVRDGLPAVYLSPYGRAEQYGTAKDSSYGSTMNTHVFWTDEYGVSIIYIWD